MWQYTSTGSVPGISGNVDLDLGYVDYPSIIKDAGLNHLAGGSAPAPSPSPQYITYVIQPGDTLSGIAQRLWHNSEHPDTAERHLRSDKIYAGNTLKVPENGTGTGSSAQYYTIRSGDTLSEIAQKFGTTVSALARLNGISDTQRSTVGNRIRVK